MKIYHRLIDSFAKTRLGGWAIVTLFNPIDKRLMRWTNGNLSTGFGTDFRDNGVLLSCTGAKSGQPREIPLLATPMGEKYILVASNAGRHKHPAWYYNLRAHPNCSLLIRGRGEVAYVAHEAEGAEKEQAWATANAQYSGYDIYQGRTDREIPIMILTPL
ncbi:nitroreductase/quinone reductase family protein [Candidatus Leptofilum sp.]|uniref:nitroreductase/quinone reductase family protein n=1 Tax=Candidatus Leptofilum sp. TaxID=3241576 RepID=UPI003B5910FB